jgi:hypothetical protein
MRVGLRLVRDLLCGYPQQVFRSYGQHLGLHEFLVSAEQLGAHVCIPSTWRIYRQVSCL